MHLAAHMLNRGGRADAVLRVYTLSEVLDVEVIETVVLG